MSTPENDLLADGAISVPDACEFAGLSRTELYRQMDRGTLPYTKIGRRRLIPRRALVAMLAPGLVNPPATQPSLS